MITYTNHIDSVSASLYSLINGEFKPVRIVFAGDLNEADFQTNNQYIKIWCEDSAWISNSTSGETRTYEYSIKYYFRDTSKIDRITLPKNWSNFGERFNQLMAQNTALTLDNIYRWHSLTMDGSDLPVEVEDEDGDPIKGLKIIDKTLFITRANIWDENAVIYDPGKYDLARFG